MNLFQRIAHWIKEMSCQKHDFYQKDDYRYCRKCHKEELLMEHDAEWHNTLWLRK